MIEAQRNVRLVGESETSGGSFGWVRVTGDAKFFGEVSCERFSLTGTAHVKGDLGIRSMSYTGDVKVDGSMRGGSLKGTGGLQLQRDFRGEELRMTGKLAASGAVEAERIDLRGALETSSLVNADEVIIRMHGPSRAKEIAGGTVTIRRSRGQILKGLLRSASRSGLEAALIEGDTLYLEYVRAEIVRGNTVRLGPGCDIGRVEYRHTLEKHASSKIGSESRV